MQYDGRVCVRCGDQIDVYDNPGHDFHWECEEPRVTEYSNKLLAQNTELSIKNKKLRDLIQGYRNQVLAYEAVLELVSMGKRPDGTYNRDRDTCELLAKTVLENTRGYA